MRAVLRFFGSRWFLTFLGVLLINRTPPRTTSGTIEPGAAS